MARPRCQNFMPLQSRDAIFGGHEPQGGAVLGHPHAARTPRRRLIVEPLQIGITSVTRDELDRVDVSLVEAAQRGDFRGRSR